MVDYSTTEPYEDIPKIDDKLLDEAKQSVLQSFVAKLDL